MEVVQNHSSPRLHQKKHNTSDHTSKPSSISKSFDCKTLSELKKADAAIRPASKAPGESEKKCAAVSSKNGEQGLSSTAFRNDLQNLYKNSANCFAKCIDHWNSVLKDIRDMKTKLDSRQIEGEETIDMFMKRFPIDWPKSKLWISLSFQLLFFDPK